MQRLAYRVEELEDIDELSDDRLPGMPLVGFITGALMSLVIWGAVAVVALSV